VTWEYVEVLNRFQWKTHSSKKLNVQRQLLDTRTVYQSYPLPLHRNGAEDPIAGFLRKFGTLDWIHWECLFWHRYCAQFLVSRTENVFGQPILQREVILISKFRLESPERLQQ